MLQHSDCLCITVMNLYQLSPSTGLVWFLLFNLRIRSCSCIFCLHKLYHVLEYCEKYAKPEDAGAKPEEKSSDEELSEDDYASSDDEVAGKADP